MVKNNKHMKKGEHILVSQRELATEALKMCSVKGKIYCLHV
jgi:hypothetical protein